MKAPRWNTALLATAALCALAISPAPGEAIVIDSFTDALPPNPLLPVSGRPVVFIGQTCDGDACPPASYVEHPDFGNAAQQEGLAGVFGGRRRVGVGSLLENWGGAPYGSEDCLVRVDPADGGRLVAFPHADHSYLIASWGYDGMDSGLNLDLVADGGDRFQIVYSAPKPPIGELYLVGGLHANGTADYSATKPFQTTTRDGVLSIPYDQIGALSAFLHDVDAISIIIFGQGPTPVPVNDGEIEIHEVRTNGGTVPATSGSWGRVKATYRR